MTRISPRIRPRFPLFGYIAAWLVAAAAIAALVVTVLGSPQPEAVTVPPVHETKLADAARAARCTLLRVAPRQLVNPPVDGAGGAEPARPGVYERVPSTASLIASLRRGIVVIHVRPDASESELRVLKTLQQALPEGTILTTDNSGIPFAVAVTAYRRLLGCPDISAHALDAVRLFRGRFVGTGPDA